MNPRIDITKYLSSGIGRAMFNLSAEVESKLERPLFELVKIRASQINGCAYCLVMHTNDARKLGENDERMHLLNAWHEAPVFTERERAALGLVDAVTKIAETHVPDDVYEKASEHFSEKELVDLTAAIVAINAWNRIAITFRSVPQLKTAKAAA